MGVKVKKIRGSWYLVINYKGHRKTKKIGGSLVIAREVARKVEAKLALGDMGIFNESNSANPLVSEYADRWLHKHIEINSKPATFALYSWLMEKHILPAFGSKRVNAVKPEHVEDFIYTLATKRKASGECVHAQKTISLIIGALRSFYSYAVRNKVAEINPAAKLGKVSRSDKPEREIESMMQTEAGLFLETIHDMFSKRIYALFLTALSTGMRRGEFIGLKWSDCAFGKDADDPNRYFMVTRAFSVHGFGTPKTKRSRRRVDMSKQLRAVLLELRDEAMLAAMQLGKDSIADEMIFPREDGEPLTPRTIGLRFMEPACQRAGLRRFTPHCLRHTFAVLMIQGGASLQYVSEQLGHSSIKITADIYGHLQPGANISQIDRLNFAVQANANQTQTHENSVEYEVAKLIDTATLSGDRTGGMNLIAY